MFRAVDGVRSRPFFERPGRLVAVIWAGHLFASKISLVGLPFWASSGTVSHILFLVGNCDLLRMRKPSESPTSSKARLIYYFLFPLSRGGA